MKGKKIDPLFVSDFISLCLKQGISSKEEILKEAQKEISEIDLKIKEIELLKSRRCKLIDVISTIIENKKDNTSQKKMLSFFNIHDANTCKNICDILLKSPISVLKLKELPQYNDNFILCIKQLQENCIVSRIGDYLVRGTMFNEYYDCILHIKV